MFKIDNHHDGDTTWFIGDLCINGCQTFTLAEAEEVFAEYDVSDEHRADVYKHLPQPDWGMEGVTEYVRWDVAANPNTPADVLTTLGTDHAEGVRWGVACNPNTPADVLTTLSTDHSVYVRQYVAENPNTPAGVLTTLSTDPDAGVRRGVAENPSTPASVLTTLSTDSDAWVRWGVARHPSTQKPM